MLNAQRGDQGLSISLKVPWGCFSCPEILVICLGLGWEPVNRSLYLLCPNWSCHSCRRQLTSLFSLWENPPWKDPRECGGVLQWPGAAIGSDSWEGVRHPL